MSLQNIRIVLVETSHPGNIGATARAMKNMGLTQLHLVSPLRFPDPEAEARASGADDLLASAVVHGDLESALAGCRWVVGTTARERTIDWPLMAPRECALQLLERAGDGNVALVFGRERSGLSNDEVDRCNALVTIPTSEEYRSLNLASAVLVLAYELRVAAGSLVPTPPEGGVFTPVDHESMERLYRHLEQVLVEIGFLDPDNPGRLMRRLRRLFNRTGLDDNELNILRGMLTAIQEPQHWRRKD
jgi:tRNA/rRNA methyltransferase/tRNA (cytidine32/uridine32-2'-O)-methyltransferase